jgi:regulator of protease activity HflC (stomatin/prohibitin superfamily)
MRTFVRDAVGAQDSQTLSTSQDKIQQFVTDKTQAWLAAKKVPIELVQVSVGNFQFPTTISDAAAEKQANIQKLQAKSSLLEIAKKDAEIEAAKAEGVRKSQDIINQTLTPIYVQHEMVQAIEALASKKGNSVIYVPIGTNGLPLVGSMSMAPVGVQPK